jgi:hypothetical protein
MDASKTLAAALAVNRVGFGLSYLVRPQQARTSWIGRAARKPGAQVIIRSQAVRDVALGAGALRAIARGDVHELRAWVGSHVLCDLVDLLVTYDARDDLPKRRARLAMGIAGASVFVGSAAVALSRSPEGPDARVSP